MRSTIVTCLAIAAITAIMLFATYYTEQLFTAACAIVVIALAAIVSEHW